jgi:hypothetical protein
MSSLTPGVITASNALKMLKIPYNPKVKMEARLKEFGLEPTFRGEDGRSAYYSVVEIAQRFDEVQTRVKAHKLAIKRQRAVRGRQNLRGFWDKQEGRAAQIAGLPSAKSYPVTPEQVLSAQLTRIEEKLDKILAALAIKEAA